MARAQGGGKFYRLFTIRGAGEAEKRRVDVSFIALAFFALIVFLGKNYGAWEGASGNVQLTLVICFLLGAVCGYKARG
jgi:hypothetical protein